MSSIEAIVVAASAGLIIVFLLFLGDAASVKVKEAVSDNT